MPSQWLPELAGRNYGNVKLYRNMTSELLTSYICITTFVSLQTETSSMNLPYISHTSSLRLWGPDMDTNIPSCRAASSLLGHNCSPSLTASTGIDHIRLYY